MMPTLFGGDVHIDYGQIYVRSGEQDLDDPFTDAFRGQVNGLCGAASPGHLCMVTGLHTGHVGFPVELHDEPPSLDGPWEEVVEVSFTPASGTVALVEWGGTPWPLTLQEVDHRARYCARGMDEARTVTVRFDHEPILDGYLLLFWPAAPGADRVVKQTSAAAAH